MENNNLNYAGIILNLQRYNKYDFIQINIITIVNNYR